MILEAWYDDKCLLRGSVVTRRGDIETNLEAVIIYVGGFDFDVTEFFSEKHPHTFELMAEWFGEQAKEQYTQIAL